jgi:tetratricopeptide (TPR) repeat protein
MEQYNAADTAFQSSLLLEPYNTEAWINRANIAYFSGQFEQALALVDSALRIDERLPQAYNTRNQILLEQQDFPAARQAIEDALELDPGNPIYLNNLGYTQLMMGALDSGLENINRSIVRDPENHWAYRNKGIYFYLLKDDTQALRYLRQSVDEVHYPEKTYLYTGSIFKRNKALEKACQEWEKSLEQGDFTAGDSLRLYCL